MKLYYVEEIDRSTLTAQDDTLPEITVLVNHPEEDTTAISCPVRQSRGHLKGSKNKQYLTDSFLSTKEKGDLELLLKL
jgi:hypothetical protein